MFQDLSFFFKLDLRLGQFFLLTVQSSLHLLQLCLGITRLRLYFL